MKKYLFPSFSIILSFLILAACTFENPARRAKSHKNALLAGEQGVHKKEVSERFLLINYSPYKEKQDRDIELLVYSVNDKGSLLEKTIRIPLGHYREDLFHLGQMVQTGSRLEKIYFVLSEEDLHDGTFEHCKLMEYDVQLETTREIMTFGDYFKSWYYYEPTHRIYAYEDLSHSLICIDPVSLKTDTLATFRNWPANIHAYPMRDDLLVLFVDHSDDGFFQFDINPLNGHFKQTPLKNIWHFNHFRNGVFLETMEVHTAPKEIRITDLAGRRTMEYDFLRPDAYWINDREFLIRKDRDLLHKINTDLEITAEYQITGINPLQVLNNHLVAIFHEDDEQKTGLFDFNLQKLIELPKTDHRHYIGIMNLPPQKVAAAPEILHVIHWLDMDQLAGLQEEVRVIRKEISSQSISGRDGLGEFYCLVTANIIYLYEIQKLIRQGKEGGQLHELNGQLYQDLQQMLGLLNQAEPPLKDTLFENAFAYAHILKLDSVKNIISRYKPQLPSFLNQGPVLFTEAELDQISIDLLISDSCKVQSRVPEIYFSKHRSAGPRSRNYCPRYAKSIEFTRFFRPYRPRQLFFRDLMLEVLTNEYQHVISVWKVLPGHFELLHILDSWIRQPLGGIEVLQIIPLSDEEFFLVGEAVGGDEEEWGRSLWLGLWSLPNKFRILESWEAKGKSGAFDQVLSYHFHEASGSLEIIKKEYTLDPEFHYEHVVTDSTETRQRVILQELTGNDKTFAFSYPTGLNR